MESSRNADRVGSDARADVQFLVRSWNRLDVLQSVATAPRPRDDLRDAVGVSRVTLSRILSDLEARGWVTRREEGYEATRSGSIVAAELTDFLATLRAIDRLGAHAERFRLEAVDFDLARLEDAELITPTWDDVSARTGRLVELVSESRHVRAVGTGLDRTVVQAVCDATIDGDLAVELVFDPPVVEAIADESELARPFADLASVEWASIYRYTGQESLMELGIAETTGDAEDVVVLCGEYDDGVPPGTILSTDSDVRVWAESYFEARRGESRVLDPAAFTP